MRARATSLLLLLLLLLRLFLLSRPSLFSSTSIKYALSTENTFRRTRKITDDGAHTLSLSLFLFLSLLSHIHTQKTQSRASVYIYLCPRAHFGSRSRNSVTVQRAELRFTDSSRSSPSLFLSPTDWRSAVSPPVIFPTCNDGLARNGPPSPPAKLFGRVRANGRVLGSNDSTTG